MEFTMFISYSHLDRAWARTCHEIVSRAFSNIDIFWDKDLIGGDDYWSTLYERSSHSDLFLYLVSDSSVESGSGCAGEVARALEYKRYIIPVILPSGVPDDMLGELQKLQYVDFRNADSDDLQVDHAIDLFKSVYEGIRSTSPISQSRRQQMFLLYKILNVVTDGDYGSDVQIYERGYELEYRFAPGLGRGVSAEICREVLDILDMMERLQYSWDELDESERKNLKDSEYAEYVIKEVGFGGNQEGQYLSYLRFLMQERRCENLSLASDKGNAHKANLSRYRRMLKVYQSIMGEKMKNNHMPIGGHLLTQDEIGPHRRSLTTDTHALESRNGH